MPSTQLIAELEAERRRLDQALSILTAPTAEFLPRRRGRPPKDLGNGLPNLAAAAVGESVPKPKRQKKHRKSRRSRE